MTKVRLETLKEYVKLVLETGEVENYDDASMQTPCRECNEPGIETEYGDLCKKHYVELDDKHQSDRQEYEDRFLPPALWRRH